MSRHKLNIILPIILTTLFLIGCSSSKSSGNLVPEESVKVAPKKEIAPAEPEFNYNFEDISPIAYSHYVTALLLESEDPPDIRGAAEHYRLALERYPDSDELRYALANTYLKLRLFNEALKVLSEVKVDDRKTLMLRGISYLQVGIQDSAKYTYEKLVQVDPNEPTAYHYLSAFYKNSGNSDSLLWAYDNLARLLPFNEMYWQELGKLRAQKGEFEQAKKDFQTSLEQNNSLSNLISYIGLAEMYKIEKKYDSVLTTYKSALLVDSTDSKLYTDIAMTYAQLDSLNEAIPYARKAIEYNPDDLLAFRRLGIIYFGAEKYDSSETMFTHVVNAGDRNFLNHYYLGRIAAQQENYHISVDEFKIMLQMNDSIPENWMDLGFSYRKLDDIQNEIATYKSGIEHMSTDADKIKLLFALGATYERGKMLDSAIVVFENILSKDKDYHQAMNYLSYMLAENNERLDYAKKLIENALKFEPNNAAYIDTYGWVYYKLEKYDKAIDYLKKAASLQDDSILFEHLGDAYNAKGKLTDAKIWWEKSLELNPDNESVKEKIK